MSVDHKHPRYLELSAKWKRCRDVIGGQDSMRAAGEVYVPRLADQEKHDYESYLHRSVFYNATWRTISGLNGMLFRKPPEVEAPGAIIEMLKDVTHTGMPLQMFAASVVTEALSVGRAGIFVDYPAVDLANATAADAQRQNLRPHMAMYKAESIINWKIGQVNNKTVLTMVVLEESATVPKDEFEDQVVQQWRVLDLEPIAMSTGIQYVYRARVFRKNEKKEDVLQSSSRPIINGKHPDNIPFYFIGVETTSWDAEEPPMIDLVDMNIAHYRVSADYEHGCHFTGLPTPVISGYEAEKEEKFYIGSMSAWVFRNPQAKAAFLEFKGEGLGSLEKNLIGKEQKMAVLGARMLEAQTRSVESANTASINRGGEQSLLACIGQTVAMGITNALSAFCRFAGQSEKVKFGLNKDFFPKAMEPLEITALVAAWQNEAIDYETLYDNLKRGEVISIDKTIEDVLKGMDKHKPTIPAGTKVNQDNTATGAGKSSIANPTQRQIQTPT